MRTATPDDFDLVRDICLDETVEPFLFDEQLDGAPFETVFERMLESDYFWIFRNGGNEDCAIASAVRFKGRGAHNFEIQNLAVKKTHQGSGLGKSMLPRVIDALKADGAERIQLFLEADNPKALALYKSFGFEEEGRMKKFVRRGPGRYVDEIIMSLTEF